MLLTALSNAIKLAPAQYREPLVAVISDFEITNQAEFLATVYYESKYLTSLVENLNYSSDALLKKFGRHRISYENALRYGRSGYHRANPQAIANAIYGGKWGLDNLGNTKENDGWHYRGQGPIQLTGRSNWEAFGKFLGREDVGQNPQIALNDPLLVCKTAGWYWTKFRDLNGCGKDMRAVTKLVTGASDTAIKTRLTYRDRVQLLMAT
jgi:putative chitinase